MSKLKPCPFCGNHANSKWFKSDDFGIECNTKSCYGIYGFETEEDAIAQWQSRPIEDTLRAELARRDEIIARLIALGDALIADEAVFYSQEQAEHYTVVIEEWHALMKELE